MLHIPERDLAFLHIPKNAGKAMRLSLENAAAISYDAIARDLQVTTAEAEHLMEAPVQLPGAGAVQPEHVPLATMAAHFPHSFEVLRKSRSLALIREPRDRFFSAILQRMGEYKDLKGLRADDPLVIEEIGNVCDHLARVGPQHQLEYTHFVRQVDYTDFEGVRVVDAIFPMDRMDKAAEWIEAKTGLKIVVVQDHVRREPKKWSRAIQPAARYIGRNLLTPPVKRAVYSLWMNSGVFANAAGRYQAIPLGAEVESFIAEYYRQDFALYKEAQRAASENFGLEKLGGGF